MYRLAKDLGRTVGEIMTMSTAEFTGWIAFYKLEQQAEREAMNRAKVRKP